jgi:ribonuclease-3
VCEAIIAALYLDGGLEAARSLIRAHWATSIAAQIAPPKDSKSELQEWAMSQGFALPDYEEVARAGPDHAPVFTMEVRVEGQVSASGTGSSKKAAESEAASALLQQLSDLE